MIKGALGDPRGVDDRQRCAGDDVFVEATEGSLALAENAKANLVVTVSCGLVCGLIEPATLE